MAGVVAVTLVALTAFDVAAVTTMRRYLLAQTDSSLQLALTLTVPRLAGILSPPPGKVVSQHLVSGGARRERPPGLAGYAALPGDFDMAFLPQRGGQVTLEVGTTEVGTARGASYTWNLSPSAAKVAVTPGPHTVVISREKTQIHLQSLRVPGGSLVAGTSLDQVDRTIG